MAKKIVRVMPNTDVTWSLAKNGFVTQSGTLPDVLTNEQVQMFLEAGFGKIACSNNTTWYVTSGGSLYGCGYNNYGQQGDGTTTDVKTFTKRADNVRDVYCGAYVTFYVDNNDDLYGCGHNEGRLFGDGTSDDKKLFEKLASNVKFFTHSDTQAWYIDNSGDLYGAGSNNYGEQGNGNTSYYINEFVKRASGVKSVYCQRTRTFYINDNNDLYGAGDYYAMGNGTTTNALYFTKIASNVKSFSCTRDTSWYIDGNGNLYGCGYNNYGNQGSGNTTDVSTFTKRTSNVNSFSCSNNTTWYIDNNNDLYGCGANGSGQQGDGTTTDVKTFTKRASNVKEVFAHENQTRYLTNNGDFYVCGNNYYGQFGTGATGGDAHKSTFTKTASNIRVLTASEQTTWYIDGEGNLYGCGNNGQGQQGNNSTTNIGSFTQRASGLAGLTANLTINPTPSDATVIIDGEETTSKDVPQGKLVDYSVGKILFKTETGAVRLYEDKNLDITLSEEAWKQKENFKDNAVTYSKSGSNVYCDDTRFQNMWKNGYKKITNASYNESKYPIIKRTEVEGSKSKITIRLPKEVTLKRFTATVGYNTTTSDAVCYVELFDNLGHSVYYNNFVCNRNSNPLTFSKTGSFKVRKIEMWDGSSEDLTWKSMLAITSLILEVE